MSEAGTIERAPESAESAAGVLDKMLSVAHVSNVYGAPVSHGETLLIPTAEVFSVAGFGAGSGGGGGGGHTFARGVAVVVSSPDGVRVRPVLDWTKIALAAVTAAGFIWASWQRMSRPRKSWRR